MSSYPNFTRTGLQYGVDSEGNLCGQPVGIDSDRDLIERKYLVYWNLTGIDGYRYARQPITTFLSLFPLFGKSFYAFQRSRQPLLENRMPSYDHVNLF